MDELTRKWRIRRMPHELSPGYLSGKFEWYAFNGDYYQICPTFELLCRALQAKYYLMSMSERIAYLEQINAS
jgi:hypothetical protein